MVFWDVVPSSLVDRYQHFRQMYFCVQDRSMKMAVAGSSDTPVYQHHTVSCSRTLISSFLEPPPPFFFFFPSVRLFTDFMNFIAVKSVENKIIPYVRL